MVLVRSSASTNEISDACIFTNKIILRDIETEFGPKDDFQGVIVDDLPPDQEDLSDYKFSKYAATYFTASVMHSYLRHEILQKNSLTMFWILQSCTKALRLTSYITLKTWKSPIKASTKRAPTPSRR